MEDRDLVALMAAIIYSTGKVAPSMTAAVRFATIILKEVEGV